MFIKELKGKKRKSSMTSAMMFPYKVGIPIFTQKKLESPEGATNKWESRDYNFWKKKKNPCLRAKVKNQWFCPFCFSKWTKKLGLIKSIQTVIHFGREGVNNITNKTSRIPGGQVLGLRVCSPVGLRFETSQVLSILWSRSIRDFLPTLNGLPASGWWHWSPED